MKISMIAAVTDDLGLGINGQLLYHISDDLRRFKMLTMGHPIIMGRKTFESFPNGPLPRRLNIVLTRDTSYTVPEGAVTASSVDEALRLADNLDPIVIGGGEIYRQFLPLASTIYLTKIDDNPQADTRFPTLNPSEWSVVENIGPMTDDRSGVIYHYLTYQRHQ